MGGIELLQGAIEKLTPAAINGGTPITVHMLDRTTEAGGHLLDPGNQCRRGVSLGLEKDGRPKTRGMINNGEEDGMAIPVSLRRRPTQIHMNFVKGFSGGVRLGWMGNSCEFALNTRGTSWVGCSRWRDEGFRKTTDNVRRGHAREGGIPYVSKAVVSKDGRVGQGLARALRKSFRC